MTRRRMLGLAACLLASATAWTSLGTFSSASGQEQTVLIDRAHSGERVPTFDRPIFVLVLGGDARTGNPANTRFDSIHILSIVPGQRPAASILGIPRDTYMAIPGRGRNKINAAGFFGGAPLTIRALEALTSCRFDYYMQISFEGFRGKPKDDVADGLINDIGGITVNVDRNYTESLPVPVKKGRQRLGGAEALSYARNRHQRPAGDFDRSRAQGTLMVAALRELRGDVRANPGAALKALAALRRHIRMNIGLSESLELGLLALRIDPRRVENAVMNGRLGTAGGASIVEVTARARTQFTDICSDGQLRG